MAQKPDAFGVELTMKQVLFILSGTVNDLSLTERTRELLRQAGIRRIVQIIDMTVYDFSTIPGFGPVQLADLRLALNAKGFPPLLELEKAART